MRLLVWSLLVSAGCVTPRAVVPYEVRWTQQQAGAPIAAGYVYRLYVNVAPPVLLSDVACIDTPSAPSSECRAPLPGAADAARMAGASSTLTSARDEASQESAPSAAFITPAGCLWNGASYELGASIVVYANRNTLPMVRDQLIAAGFEIVQVRQVSNNRFEILARCIGST